MTTRSSCSNLAISRPVLAIENLNQLAPQLAVYPAPPFPRQPQKPPGLVGKMTPAPDHGEESYAGFGRMTGRKALITGGDSGIGRASASARGRRAGKDVRARN